MTYSAPKVISSLVNEYGWDAVVDALIVEVEWSLGGDLSAVEELLEVVMADLPPEENPAQLTMQ